MKNIKRLLSLVLVMALALSMNITSFAVGSSNYVRPVRSVEASIDGVDLVLIGDLEASIVKDVNENGVTEDQIYIRANLTDSTEYALKSQTITIISAKAIRSIMASRRRNTGEGFIYRLRFSCLCEDNRRGI